MACRFSVQCRHKRQKKRIQIKSKAMKISQSTKKRLKFQRIQKYLPKKCKKQETGKTSKKSKTTQAKSYYSKPVWSRAAARQAGRRRQSAESPRSGGWAAPQRGQGWQARCARAGWAAFQWSSRLWPTWSPSVFMEAMYIQSVTLHCPVPPSDHDPLRTQPTLCVSGRPHEPVRPRGLHMQETDASVRTSGFFTAVCLYFWSRACGVEGGCVGLRKLADSTRFLRWHKQPQSCPRTPVSVPFPQAASLPLQPSLLRGQQSIQEGRPPPPPPPRCFGAPLWSLIPGGGLCKLDFLYNNFVCNLFGVFKDLCG